ncbi:MAG: mycodextranase [Glaciihabitans sp.]|nr:mycodextranase [Glaciihabitans sp.]
MPYNGHKVASFVVARSPRAPEGASYPKREIESTMTRNFHSPLRASRSRSGWLLAASATTLALAASTALGGAAAAEATTPSASPVVTRAAIDPSLVAGRGADVSFSEQEAEKATTNGSILPVSTAAYTLPAEASGRSAVSLTPGQYVEFTLPSAANAITVRYSIPDAPTGGGITSPLKVAVNGGAAKTMTLTSQYAWLYNQYPFSNDPNAGILFPDQWIAECGCVPDQTSPTPTVATPYRPNHFYDEQRLLLSHRYPAGSTIRLTVPTGSGAATTVVDLLDSQLVARPKVDLRAANVLLFGADPFGKRDSADAFDKAIAFAKKAHLKVYVPPGTYQVDRHIIVDNVTIEGAGSWYTIITGHQVTLSSPAADGSLHTGVGFYGKDASVGGSTNVHLSGFAIVGDVRDRVDTDQVNGIGGALNNSTIDGLYIDHTKAGIWIDGPVDNLKITNNIIVNQTADGINFHTGVTNSLISNNFIRNTGDDAIALWSDKTEDANNVIDHNTIQTPVLANGLAVYGGTDNTLSNNLVADPIREGSGIQVGSRFGAEAFTGHLWITNNTTVRAGTYELNWNIGLGAIWFYALQKNINADIQVTGDNFLDNTYNAIMLVSDFPVKDLYSITNVHFKDIHVDGTGTSVLSARVAGSATFENVDARNVGAVGINNCGSFHFTPAGSEFTPVDLGGNDGGGTTGPWMASWELPNTITCNDRPAVVVPPVPSAWS